MLDMDHGTYPFVTSSNPTAGGACVGAGMPPTAITQVIGVTKAYTTRVGSGPFPTELFDEFGVHLRKIGREYGTTTGRERRTGWFDAVVARYATRLNGITDLVVTKLDVLSGLEKVPICVAYEMDGKRTDEMPMTQTEFHHAKPIYEELPGWWEDISKARAFERPAGQRAALHRADRGARGHPRVDRRCRPRPGRERGAPRAALTATAVLRSVVVRVLLLGSGGREHAIAAALAADPAVTDLICAPGNPGTAADRGERRGRRARSGARWPPSPSSAPSTSSWSARRRRWWPGSPTRSARKGIACFGPSQAAAQLEGSKAFAKDVMRGGGRAHRPLVRLHHRGGAGRRARRVRRRPTW